MKKKNTIIKCIFINIIAFCSLVLFLEVSTYLLDYYRLNKHYYRFETKYNFQPYYTKILSFEKMYFENKRNPNYFRAPVGTHYKNKRPIILFGCSFTYGTNLEANETMGYLLSEYTKRPVFNRGIGGWGIQQMVFQLKKEDSLNEIKSPEYIIYTFIPDQINRLTCFTYFNYQNFLNLIYRPQANGLTEVKPLIPILYKLYSVRFLTRFFDIHNNNNNDKNFDLLKLHFETAKELANEKYPNVKFVILKYEYGISKTWYSNTPRWKELEKEGFIIFDAEELAGVDLNKPEYKLFDGHPSKKAWESILPPLIKKLNL